MSRLRSALARLAQHVGQSAQRAAGWGIYVTVGRQMNLNLTNPLLGLTRSCEVNCVAGCCGTDAFEVTYEHMVGWIEEHGIEAMWTALDQLSDLVHRVEGYVGVISSPQDEFNTGWERPGDCIDYFTPWRHEMIRAAQSVTGRSLEFPADWRTAVVDGLAKGIEFERDFGRLPILADALEEAGCDQPDILRHCRQDTQHARGCWVVEGLLGKS